MGEIPAGQVTIADLYRELSGMRSDLSAVLSKFAVVDNWRQNTESKLLDQESRLRALERFRYTMAGLSVIGGILAGAVGYFVGHLVK